VNTGIPGTWEEHKLSIVSDLKELKDDVHDLRRATNEISTSLTALQTVVKSHKRAWYFFVGLVPPTALVLIDKLWV
jgi:hypothetical protein